MSLTLSVTHAGSMSSFITEQYVAISDFAADKTMGNQLSLTAREVVVVMKRNEYGKCCISFRPLH